MSRKSTKDKRREELLPQIADAFAELGYRKATTSQIASRCGVQETILYRLWDDKKSMFLKSIEYLFDFRMKRIRSVLAKVPEGEDHLSYLIEDVASTLGKHGLQRVIYAALGEIADPEISGELQKMYRHNYELILKLLHQSTAADGPPSPAKVEDTAWATIGLVTILDLSSTLELLGPRQRSQVFKTRYKSAALISAMRSK